MDEKLKNAYKNFYRHNYKEAKDVFAESGLFYEAGVCSLFVQNLKEAREFFELKKEICTASQFALNILDLIEDKPLKKPTYFQVRCFLEIYINLMIENGFFDWAQKIIDRYEYYTGINVEVPKFIARVLCANNYNSAVHAFCNVGKELCFNDAEVHYIDALVYIKEKDFKSAKKCIQDCLSFAPEYYPILKLKKDFLIT